MTTETTNRIQTFIISVNELKRLQQALDAEHGPHSDDAMIMLRRYPEPESILDKENNSIGHHSITAEWVDGPHDLVMPLDDEQL